MIPKKGKSYFYFDDGKRRLSRRGEVLITDIIPFNDADEYILFEWNRNLQEISHLFANKTDYFVKGILIDNNELLIFARTNDGGWFSFNSSLWDGRLDVDDSINDSLS